MEEVEGCMVGSVLDSEHSVEVIDGEGLYLFHSFPGCAARSGFYSQDSLWIEMTMIGDHKLQMVVACSFFPIFVFNKGDIFHWT